MDNQTLDALEKRYPKGTKVKLVQMDDVQAPPVGTIGIVDYIDSIGTIHIDWENGSTLGAVYGADIVEKI